MSSAKIYLADHYTTDQNDGARSISIFNNGCCSFNNLSSVKDETIAPGWFMEYYLHTAVVLLPVVGRLLVYLDDEEKIVSCGELLLIHQANYIKVINNYSDALINYMIVIFRQPFSGTDISKFSFDLNNVKNEMQDLLDNPMLKIAIGKFEMRRNTTYFINEQNKCSFCWVLQGSFEIEGRLLHARDALAIWNTSMLDMESLGKESILLLIEQELTNNNQL